MTVEPPRRHPTRKAINTISAHFSLPNEDWMQDWEIQVAEFSRLDEFIDAYRSADLDDDERFTLMAVIIHCLDRPEGLSDPRWETVVGFLERDLEIHASTIVYWSCSGRNDPDEQFFTTPLFRALVSKNGERLEKAL